MSQAQRKAPWIVCTVAVVTGVLTACSATPAAGPTVTVTAPAPTSASAPASPEAVPEPEPSVSTLAPGEVAPQNMRPRPTWAETPTKERVLACRASEAAFAASPEPLAIRRNGTTNRIPTYEEYELALEARRRAMDLEQVEFGLMMMTVYWWDKISILSAAMSGNPKKMKKLVYEGTFIWGGDGKPVDFWDGIELLNDACATVGTVTSFGSLPTHQPPDWLMSGE
jgi:hypothetical protein